MRLRADQGTFLLFSGATYIAGSRNDGFWLAERGGRSDNGLVVGASVDLNTLSFSSLRKEQVDFLLVHEHERNHFEQYFSSPLGLVIFRCYLALSSTLNWLFHRFFKPGGLGSEALVGGSFRRWIAEDSLAWIRQKIDSGALRIEGGTQRLGYLQTEVLPELESIAEFLVLLMGRQDGTTMGDFANVANKAWSQLAKRGDVPLAGKWSTRFPDSPLHPDILPILTGTELFELSALTTEMKVLSAIDAPAEAIVAWVEAYAEPPYSTALNMLHQSDAGISLHAQMAQVAFRSPFDPVIRSGGDFLVETHHPSWRYRHQFFIFCDTQDCPRSGLTVVQRRAEFQRRIGTGEPMEDVLCDMSLAELPSFAKSWRGRPFGALIGPGARVLPEEGDKVEGFDARQGVRVTLDRFETCLRYAADGNDAALRGVREQIVYHDDMASFPALRTSADLLGLMGYHSAGITAYLQLSNFLEDVYPAHVPPFGSSVHARLRRLLGDLPDHLAETLSTGAMAREVFGDNYAKAVGLA